MPYLETVLIFLGLTDVHLICAEGLALGKEAEQRALAAAYEEIEEAVNEAAVAA